MTARRRGQLALGGWAVAAALATFALHRAGGPLPTPSLAEPGVWAEWLTEHDPVVAAVAVLRLLALAAGWYVLATLVVGAAARSVRLGPLVTLTDRLTAPALRRLLTAAAGMTLASSVPSVVPLALGPHPAVAVASPAPPLATVAASQLSGGSTTTITVGSRSESGSQPPPTLVMRLLPGDGAASQPAPVVPGPEPAVIAAATHPVRLGECFWSIAEDALAEAWGRVPTAAEIIPYWEGLIEANRAVLADPANPDLVFAGQTLTMPAAPAP